jgi:hypothetical protein
MFGRFIPHLQEDKCREEISWDTHYCISQERDRNIENTKCKKINRRKETEKNRQRIEKYNKRNIKRRIRQKKRTEERKSERERT